MEHTIMNEMVIMRDDQAVADFGPITENLFNVKGKTAVVTGAGQGMGRAIASCLARFGANVAAVDINGEAASKTAKEIRKYGVKSQHYQTDICDYGAVQKMTEAIYREFSNIDILVNNAGIGSASSFPDTDEETWNRVIKINLGGTFNCSKASAGYMIRQQRGIIINIGSSLSSRAAVLNCLGGSPEYCVSKAGIQALTRSMAQFLAKDGIRVNAVAPGPVDSPMHADRREGLAAELPRVPLGRIQNCDDIAGTVIFLASEASRFITGQTIHVNGGMLMAD